ncbi:carboxypeptidase B-like [Condylostylus longicornis]|uniref:carboxypeptidase B-like n=1 Tax=Condylostylus longicornis TaxID=2530218 RepID=UPI00244E003F|nr:carboxypeptidase B-like [Condylostylus longicornis]
MKLKKYISFITIIISFTILNKISAVKDGDYTGYKKYYVTHDSDAIREYMVGLQLEETDLDFWLISENSTTVLVPAQLQENFEKRLTELNSFFNKTSIYGNEYDSDIDSEVPLIRGSRQVSGSFFRSFHRYDTILQYMIALARRYPSIARYETFGRSAEGRAIGALSISITRGRPRKLAYIQAGAHAREWITPTTVLYFAAELLANIQFYRRILNDVEVYIVPVLNPDGYEYSHTRDRFWRKNRHFYSGLSCRGVDLNRNFGVYWNYVGSSQNLCSEVYSGRSPYSEPETQAVRRFLEANRFRAKLVLDIHSYGKYIFYPWGYTKFPARNRNFLHSVALRAANSIAKYRGTIYRIGTSAQLLYEASGGLDDWAYGVLGIPLTYTLELPGSGFVVPNSEIIPIGKETYAAFIEFLSYLDDEQIEYAQNSLISDDQSFDFGFNDDIFRSNLKSN